MAYNSCLDFILVAETQQFERLCPSVLQSVRLFAPYAGAEKHEDVHLRLCPPPPTCFQKEILDMTYFYGLVWDMMIILILFYFVSSRDLSRPLH